MAIKITDLDQCMGIFNNYQQSAIIHILIVCNA